MCQTGWRALVCTAAMAATAATLALDSSSDEELRQAIVLVEILKSGNGFRGGTFPGRRSANASRQFQYDDPFGPQPEGNAEDGVNVSSYPQPNKEPLISNNATSPHPISKQEVNLTTASAAETTTAKNKTNEITETTSIKPTETRTKETTKPSVRETPKTIATQIAIESTNSVTNFATTASKTGILKQNHDKNGSNSTEDLSEKEKDKLADGGNELEVAQAALELQHEAADVRGTPSPQHHRTITTDQTNAALHTDAASPSDEVPKRSSTGARFRGSTRVHLSRSSRPAIPLPENNAFCFTNPESPLCRTFI